MGMKKIMTRLVAVFLVAALTLPVAAAQNGKGPWKNPYSDVTENQWSYSYIARLSQAGILPDSDKFRSTDQETRLEFVAALYAMHLSLGGKAVSGDSLPFTDVPADSADYDAVLWAYESGVVNGVSETSFNPGGSISRQDTCTMLLRFAREEKLSLCAVDDAQQFADSLSVRQYARTPVTVCQMSGLVNGYDNGYFRPAGFITRQECAAVLCRLLDAAEQKPEAGALTVDLTDGAYDSLYDGYTAPPSGLVEKSDAVDLSYFDDAVFIGDSVSLMLQYYCASTKALGNAQFLCAGSLSPANALWNVSSQSVHPSYQGKKMLVEDGVAACGAKKVYIMLGINSLRGGVDSTSQDLVTLIDRILAKSPDVSILVESVTPMAASSTIITDSLNNTKIQQYNDKMKSICEERGWYFINVAEALRDKDGYLPAAYCGDNNSMGIHFTYDGCKVWVDYLKTHAPEALK